MSSDGEVPEGRCGFVLEPEDVHEDVADEFEAESDRWYELSDAACCWREVWAGADDDRCIWHVDTDDKPAGALIRARSGETERLDGVFVPATDLGDAVDFKGCRLWAATFEGTDLRKASFTEVDGRFTQFPDANLSGALFLDANLRDAHFLNADLTGAQFHDSYLRRAQFSDADLQKAKFPDADLTETQFSGANLTEAQFHDADLYRAQFDDAYLYRVQFEDVDLSFAQFLNANLQFAQFPGAFLGGVRYPHADLRWAKFPDANLVGAELPEAKLRGAKFLDAYLSYANLTDANISNANFTRTNLEHAILSNADLADADLTDTRLHDAHLLDVRINEGTKFGEVTPDETRAMLLTPVGVQAYVQVATGTATELVGQLDYDPRRIPSTDPPREGLLPHLATLPVVRRLHDKLQPKYEAVRRWWFWYSTDRDSLELPYEDLGKANKVYRTIQRLYRENSMPRRIDTYYVRARDTRRKQAIIDGDLPRWLYLAAQRWVMGYGERPWRVVATSGLVILGCAVAYPLVGGVTETSTGGGTPHYFAVPLPDVLPAWMGLPGAVETVLTSLYFSVVTFTTLGYGDLRPRTGAAQFLATFESLVGAFLLALLVYVLGRRATR